MRLNDYLKNHILIPDGSMGTYYSEIINQPGAVSEFANQSNPDLIERIHREYIEAGAEVLRTNTFAANREVLRVDKKTQESIIKAACQIATKAVASQSRDESLHPIWILGDIGPIPEDSDSDEEEIMEEYKLMCDAFIEEGLDGIHFETFSNVRYIEKLVPYIKHKKNDMFVLASFCVNKNGYTGAGVSAARILEKVSHIEGIDGCGLNCGIGSGHMYSILKKLAFPSDKFIYAAPNAGYPEQMQNRMVFMDNAEYFSDNMELIARLGVDIIGGCCGTTPEYIRNMSIKIANKGKVNSRHIVTTGEDRFAPPVKENDFYRQLKSGKKVIAVELDPPFDANIDQVMEGAHILSKSGVDMITFADSPMGRSRVDSILMSIKIAEVTGLNVTPHVCCRDRNMISMRSTLLGAYIHGIRNLLIVTGDPVPGDSRTKTTGVFDYNSIQLMDYVKEMNCEHFKEEPFCYGGALNYGRGSLDNIMKRIRRKMDAGATFFLTQPIYSAEDVQRIKEIKENADIKILCGIMPLVSYRNACFIKNEISGIHVPDDIINRYRPDMSREEAEDTGVTITLEIMRQLDSIADGYYFMLPFNRVSLMDKILNRNDDCQ